MSSGTNDVFVANKSFSSLPVQRWCMHGSRVLDYKKIHARPLLSLRNSANVRDFPVCGTFYFFFPGIFFTPVFVFGSNPLVPTNTYRFLGTWPYNSTICPFVVLHPSPRTMTTIDLQGKGVCVYTMSGINWSVWFEKKSCAYDVTAISVDQPYCFFAYGVLVRAVEKPRRWIQARVCVWGG